MSTRPAKAERSDAALLEELGRQITLERRAQILRELARPGAADLVRPIARSGFARREPEVRLLIDALAIIGTGEAVFALSRLAQTSEWEAIRTAARERRPRAGEPVDPSERAFLLMARELSAQKTAWQAISSDQRQAVVEVQQGLLAELDRDRGTQGNAYLRLLARGITEFALVAGVGGRLEETAARRLGGRTDLGRREVALMRCMQPGRRGDFLRAALEGKDPDRAAIALEVLRDPELDTDVAERSLGWLDSPADALAIAAVRAALARGLVSSRVAVGRILDRAARAAPGSQRLFATALIADAATLPALPLQAVESGDLRRAIVESARGTPGRPLVADLLAAELRRARDPRGLGVLATALTTLREDESRRHEDAMELLRAGARVLSTLGRRWRAMADTLAALAETPALRAALWHAVVALESEDASTRSRLPRMRELALAAVAAAEPEETLADRLADTLGGAPSEHVMRHVARLVHRRPTVAERLASELEPALAARLAEGSRAERDLGESEMSALSESLEDEAATMRAEFIATVRPLVERAIAGSEGNERLQYQYRRLIEGFERESPTTKSVREDNGTSPGAAEPAPGAGDLLELLDLDRTARSGPPARREGAATRRSRVTQELAESGEASELLRELFEGGPRQRAMLRVSGDGRAELLRSALAAGLRPPAAWMIHPALGDWLSTRMLDLDAEAIAGEAASEVPLASVLRQGADTEQRLSAAKRRRADHRRAARGALARGVAPALDELDALVFGYASVRRALELMGWTTCARLGSVIARADVDPMRHQLLGDAAERYVVRSAGIEIDGEPLIRAVLEPAENGGGGG